MLPSKTAGAQRRITHPLIIDTLLAATGRLAGTKLDTTGISEDYRVSLLLYRGLGRFVTTT
jgi:hypothetical protein